MNGQFLRLSADVVKRGYNRHRPVGDSDERSDGKHRVRIHNSFQRRPLIKKITANQFATTFRTHAIDPDRVELWLGFMFDGSISSEYTEV